MMGWLTAVGVGLLVIACIIWSCTRGEEYVHEYDDHYPLELVRPLKTPQETRVAIRKALKTEEANRARIDARIRKYREQLRR